MNNQVKLTGFEELNEHEHTAFQLILPHLQTAAAEIGADARCIEFKPTKSYSSVYYGNTLIFRLKLRGKLPFIEFPVECKEIVGGIAPTDQQKTMGDFLRIYLDSCDSSSVITYAAALSDALTDIISRLPKEWDCCSRYLECSNAKKCIHPDPAFALGCGYRKILASGKIFYGENRNID